MGWIPHALRSLSSRIDPRCAAGRHCRPTASCRGETMPRVRLCIGRKWLDEG